MVSTYYKFSNRFQAHVWSTDKDFDNKGGSQRVFHYNKNYYSKETSLKEFEKTLGVNK